MTVIGSLLDWRSSGRRADVDERAMDPWGDWGSGDGAVWAGSRVTPKTSIQLLTVYGCARFIAGGISSLPVDTLTRRPNGTLQEVTPPDWVIEPTVDLDWIDWTGQMLVSLLISGNAWCWKAYGDGGDLRQLIPLDPAVVGVQRPSGGRRVITVNGAVVDPGNLLHISGMMWPGALLGLSPVEAARQSIGQGMAAQEYSARFFNQDATPSGVIEVPGEMPPDKAKETAASWSRKHSGKSKVGLPGVLTGGATWKPTAVTNEQAQFLESRGFTAAEIAGQMFLVDPSEMGLPVNGTSLTYANLTERNARKVQVTFLPWIVRLEKAITRLLPKGQYLKINTGGLLRGDAKTRYQSYATGIRHQFLTPNEARAFEDWPPIEGGDVVVKGLPGEVKVSGSGAAGLAN